MSRATRCATLTSRVAKREITGRMMVKRSDWIDDTQVRCLLTVIIGTLYFALTPALIRKPAQPAHFLAFARAFADGRLCADPTRDGLRAPDELIPGGHPTRWYLAYPPLPAIVLVPFVAIGGPAVTTEAVCRLFCLLDVLLFDACLKRMIARLGFAPLSVGWRLAWNLFFALGTALWHNSARGGDWHLAHAVALAGMLLALHESFGKNRSPLIGLWMGAVLLTRPSAAPTALFFLWPRLKRLDLRAAAGFLAPVAIALAALLYYNHARFDSWLDFGYGRMVLRGSGLEAIRRYGQFHLHFVPINFFWFFLAPPWPLSPPRPPWLGYDPSGMSLFLASPPFVFALLALRRANPNVGSARSAACAIGLSLVPLLMYFNTGFWQFGHRFSLDYLPLLMLMTLIGVGGRPRRAAGLLFGLAIIVQSVGVLAEPVALLPNWLRM